jgi:hypothetical protein
VQKLLLIFLCSIVFLTVIAVLSANLGFPNDSATTQSFAKWGMAAVLGEIIGLFVFVGHEVFRPKPSPRLSHFSLIIFMPKGLERLVPLVSWDEKKSFLILRSSKNGVFDEEQLPMTPVLEEGSPGRAWEIKLPIDLYDKIGEINPVRLLLTDNKGYQWDSGSFYLLRRQLILRSSEDPQKIMADYQVKI